MNPHRGLLHHLNIIVSDVPQSARFYGPVLRYLGYERTAYRHEGEWPFEDWKPWKLDTPHELSFSQADKKIAGSSGSRRGVGCFTHMAFCAADREDMDRFYHEVLVPLAEARLATIQDPPCECPEYGTGYYATFFFDPDGLKYEFVFTPDYLRKKNGRAAPTSQEARSSGK